MEMSAFEIKQAFLNSCYELGKCTNDTTSPLHKVKRNEIKIQRSVVICIAIMIMDILLGMLDMTVGTDTDTGTVLY